MNKRELEEKLKKTSAGRKFLEEAEPEKQTDNLIEFAKDQCEIFPEDSYMGKYLRETIKILQAEPCEDAISRTYLLKKFEDRFIELQKAHQKEKQLGINWCINTLKDMPPVTPTQRWIPVSERLPEKFQRVLITIVNYNGYKVVRVAEYYNRVFRVKENHEQWEVNEKGLLAWMPLPKPYKESEEE